MSIRDMNSEITATLRELLYEHDCVIIPGFGAFICNYVPAAIEKERAMLHPPARHVSFNRNLVHNDGLLVGALARSRGVDFRETREETESYVGSMRRRLAAGETITLEGIGGFSNNREGNIQFDPDRSINFNLAAYGMESFMHEPLEQYDVRRRIAGTPVARKVRRIPSRKLLIGAAITIPAIIALAIIPLATDLLGDRLSNATFSPFKTSQVTETTHKPDIEAITAAVMAELARENLIARPSTPSTQTAATEESIVSGVSEAAEIIPTTKYIIIAGSFHSEENASVLAGQLRAKGYTPEIVPREDGFVRVAAIEFTDKGKARAERESMLSDFPGSWILTRN